MGDNNSIVCFVMFQNLNYLQYLWNFANIKCPPTQLLQNAQDWCFGIYALERAWISLFNFLGIYPKSGAALLEDNALQIVFSSAINVNDALRKFYSFIPNIFNQIELSKQQSSQNPFYNGKLPQHFWKDSFKRFVTKIVVLSVLRQRRQDFAAI